MNRRLVVLLFSLVLAPSSGAQVAEPIKRDILATAGALDPTLRTIAYALWDFSETALREHRSAELLATLLEDEGFTVERGVAGMPTAFVARYGSGTPAIGILAEYDALPGVGNAAVPRRAERDDGVTSGQGCGHNLFGAGSVGGAILLKQAMEAHGLAGTLILFGTPAEETVVGKVYMARAGVFDGLDAVLEWHPGLTNEVNNNPGRAMNNFEVEFHGQAAHASTDPWNGRSALDAVELMNYGVNLMREHIRPTARVHYVIPRGGEAPNVVPEYARVWYFVRDIDRPSVASHYAWIADIAAGAAQATRTEHRLHLITGVHEYNLNRPLQEAVQRNLVRVGAPAFTADEQAFARELQAFLEIEQTGYATDIAPLAEGVEPPGGGSTDVAEVSYLAPTVGFSIATAAGGVPWHSWATTACHGTDAGVKGAYTAARILALTGIDLLTDRALRDAARAFFLEKTGGAAYVSPIPVDQPPPLPDAND